MTEKIESVAKVLEQESAHTIERWLKRVEEVPTLMAIPLSSKDRTGHLPQLIADLVTRLGLKDGAVAPETTSAHDHGEARFEQGYIVSMLVDESRLLQVSIFDTLRRNQAKLDPDTTLDGVVIIADECDAQLKHTVETFMKLEEQKGSRAA